MMKNPHVLTIGDRVEICPYPTSHKVSYDSLQGLDGMEGKVIGLADFGPARMARVSIKSTNPDLNGLWRVPVKCLKVLT